MLDPAGFCLVDPGAGAAWECFVVVHLLEVLVKLCFGAAGLVAGGAAQHLPGLMGLLQRKVMGFLLQEARG